MKAAEPAIADAIACLKEKKPFPATRSNLYDRFMSSAVNPIFYRLFVKAAAFQVRDDCIGCGQCADRCPMNNITIKAGVGKRMYPLYGMYLLLPDQSD